MNRKSHEDSKPPARDTLTGNTDASENRAGQVIVAECSGQNEEVSISLYARGNTKEFSHALNLLPTERIPMYTREFDSILTFPEKVRRFDNVYISAQYDQCRT